MINGKAKIEYNSEDKIVFVTTHGKVQNADDTMHLFNEVTAICVLEYCKKILFDATLTKKLLSASELYKVAEYMTSKHIFVASLCIAYVIPAEISDDFSFFETVSINRGARMRSFTTVDEAKAWLLNED